MTSFTSRRQALYTPQQMADARAAWAAGQFSAEWRPWRHMAAMEAGIIVPPSGTSMDQWDDEHPSERAQVIRAIRETPRALEAALKSPNVRSWSAVIAQVVRRRESIRIDLEQEERDLARRKEAELTPRQATKRIADILEVIAGSR